MGYTEFTSANDPSGLAALHSGLDQIAALDFPAVSREASFLRRKTAFRDARFRYYTVGAAYDDGPWLAQAEVGKTDTEAGMSPSSTTGYLSIGRRFNTLTPFAVVSRSRPSTPIYAPQSDWTALGASAVGLQKTVYGWAFQPHVAVFRTLEAPSVRVKQSICRPRCQFLPDSPPGFGVQ